MVIEGNWIRRTATTWISFGKWRLTWLKLSECFPEPDSCFQTFCSSWTGEVRLAGIPTASNGASSGSTGRCLASWQRDRWAAFATETSACLIRTETESTWAQSKMSFCWATSEKLCRRNWLVSWIWIWELWTSTWCRKCRRGSEFFWALGPTSVHHVGPRHDY